MMITDFYDLCMITDFYDLCMISLKETFCEIILQSYPSAIKGFVFSFRQ